MSSEPRGNLWQASSAEAAVATPLARDREADLAVVGGGFTGCSAALEAAGSGASICLLEAEEVGHGGSGRNVGLVNAGLWLPPDDLIGIMGEEAGNRLVRILAVAPGEVFDRIATHGIDCEARRAGTLHCAPSPSGLANLRERHRQGNRHGAPLALLDAGEARRRTGARGLHGALFDPHAGTVQPRAYCRGLARAATDQGAAVHDRSPVTAIYHDGSAWSVTANGHTVRARALLVATNAYHLGIEGLADPHFVPVHFSQVATAPMPEAKRTDVLPGGEGCWDTALVMSSFRTDRPGRLILGAIGNFDGPGGAVHASWARRKLDALYPQLGELAFEHAWQGRIAMTSDHIPKILAFGPNALAPFGYSGRGIAPGTVFGAAAARALLSGDDDHLPIAPIRSYSERFRNVRAGYYELGATMTHAVSPRPRLG